jgi:hypothetical protein
MITRVYYKMILRARVGTSKARGIMSSPKGLSGSASHNISCQF